MNLKEFINPSKQYRPTLVWAWNEVIDPIEVENRIRDMKKKGFGGFFIYAGRGLRTLYLGDEWMKAVRRALEISRELDMECWLSDEDSVPSGSCGGKTTEGHDENLAMALTWFEDASQIPENLLNNAIVYTRTISDGNIELIKQRPDSLAGVGVFIERHLPRGVPSPHGENDIDTMNPETVQSFIENTYESYANLFKYDFGEFMPGISTGEPNTNRRKDPEFPRSFSFPWTVGFVQFFEKMFEYSPIDSLHYLLGGEEGFSFRHDYWRAVNTRFIDAYTKPLSVWCKEHKLLFTGYFRGEDSFAAIITSGGAVMPQFEYMDVPAVTHHGKTPVNLWAVKQVSSVANQLGKNRALARLYDSGGNGLSFTEMKKIADFHIALGATSIAPLFSTMSLKGERKRDSSPSFSYHQPWWKISRVMSDYLARCSWVMSQGRSTARILVMEPTTSAYGAYDCHRDDGGDTLKKLETSYRTLVEELVSHHISFDLGDERLVRRQGKVKKGMLTIGQVQYSLVILPPALTWRSSTIDMLTPFTGTVVIMGEIPGRVEGKPSERIKELTAKNNVIFLPDETEKVIGTIAEKEESLLQITTPTGEPALSVMVNHRIEASAHILFLANKDTDKGHDIIITVKALGGTVELDPATGRAYRYDAVIRDGHTIIETTLPPSGSRIFLIDQTQTSVTAEILSLTTEPLTISGPYSFRRLNDNTLVLDTCSLTINAKPILTNESVWKAKRALWRETGIEEFWGYQPWALEKKNIRTKTNTSMLTFTFQVKDIPETIALAVESADRFTVATNGTEVKPSPGRWHIDKGFTALTLAGYIKEGMNTITLTTDFLWDTEIENIYLFGDFAVGSESEGFPLIKEPETLTTGSWINQGYPFYTGSMSYKMSFDLRPKKSEQYELDLSGLLGVVSSLKINDVTIGVVPFPPYRAEISGALKRGTNTVEVEFAGSLRNALGPLHHNAGDTLDIISPDVFTDEGNWTDSYRFIPYGFIKEPVMVISR